MKKGGRDIPRAIPNNPGKEQMMLHSDLAVKLLEISKEITFDAIVQGGGLTEDDPESIAKKQAKILAEVYNSIKSEISK